MVDPILNARLDVLEQELNLTNDPNTWLQKLCLKKYEIENEDLFREWNKFTNLVGERLEEQKQILREIRDRLKQIEHQDDQAAGQVMNHAWADYTNALDRSQILFREFLEFVGGLIFRDKQFDLDICDLADELIRFYSPLVFTGSSISVPAARDSLTKSVGWMVRVRFPEWTIWTLPFAAYEYGHVVLKEFNRIKEPIGVEIDKWLETDPEFQALPADKQAIERNKGSFKDRAESYVKEFLADAFATYLMGPAYACPAILLRFDPGGASTLSKDRPDDAKRAYVVLEILKAMNSGKMKPYDWVVDYLRDNWAETQKRVNAIGLTDPEKARLDALVQGWREFTPKFLPVAKYPDTGADGWTIAGGWAQKWSEQLMQGVMLQRPAEINHLSRLRDVLNAAWICRIQGTDPENAKAHIDAAKIAQIAAAARDLCNEIRLKVYQQKQQSQRKVISKIPGYR